MNDSNKERDTLAAFAGMIILFAILAIIFGVSAPRGSAETAEEAAVLEGTEEELVAEATELAPIVEETEAAPVVEIAAEVTEAAAEAATESVESSSVASSSNYAPELIAQGQTLFVTCSACHGPDGRGITGLGKDLVAGEFTLTTSDADLVTFIMTGRPIWDAANTTGVDMPARGGNPALTEDDVLAIVAYLRSLQGTNGESSVPETETSSAVSSSYAPELIAQGQTLFVTCSACHGPDGRGITGLGKDLVAGEFTLTTSDADLVTFIMTGRPIWDAANTTGVDMPARGGNPALTEDDVLAIVAYLRSLQTP